MKIKKYVVRDMHEALKLIREDLGPDAVIISSYKLPRKGLFDLFSPRMMEVTAAMDDRKKTVPADIPRLAWGGDHGAGRLLDLLRKFDSGGIRKSLDRDGRRTCGRRCGDSEVPFDIILKNKGNFTVDREINQNWKKILTSLEIHESIVENLVVNIEEVVDGRDYAPEMYDGLMVLLKGKISRLLEPAYRPSPRHRICAFVGPSGAGKTLSMAKLATHYSIYEKKSVVLISAGHNGHWPGQLETLKYFGGLIGAPVEQAGGREELVQAVDRYADKDMILVDTAGVNPKNAGMMLKLNKLLEPVGSGREIYLVLSSTTKGADLIRTAVEFQKIGYTKMIFTRLDETDSCGSIMNVVCRTGVPVAFVSYGQNVPDDITSVNPKKLAGLLLGGVDRYVEPGLRIRF